MYGRGIILVLLCLEMTWVQTTRTHQCQFTSPDPRHMIEHLPGQFIYEISSVENLESQKLPINLNVTDLYGQFAYEAYDDEELADVLRISNPRSDRKSYGDSNFNASCQIVYSDDDNIWDQQVSSYCWYEGFVVISAERYVQETHRYFMVERGVQGPVCSLTIIKYSPERARLQGTFLYDEYHSNGSSHVFFKFKLSKDTFPRPVQVARELSCNADRPDKFKSVPLTRITDDLYSTPLESLAYKDHCQVNISNHELSITINVAGLYKMKNMVEKNPELAQNNTCLTTKTMKQPPCRRIRTPAQYIKTMKLKQVVSLEEALSYLNICRKTYTVFSNIECLYKWDKNTYNKLEREWRQSRTSLKEFDKKCARHLNGRSRLSSRELIF